MTASVLGSLGILQGPGGLGSDPGVQISNSSLTGSPDAPPATAALVNDEFTSTVLSGKWTWRNQQPTGAGNPQANAVFDGITNLTLTIAPLGAGSGNTSIFSLIGQPITSLPVAPWAVGAKVQVATPGWLAATPGTPFNGCLGIALYESATGKVLICGVDQANGIGFYAGTALNNPTPTSSFTIGPTTVSYLSFIGVAHYFRVSFAAGTYYLWWSATGRSWTLLTSFAQAAHFTTAADTIGLGFSQRSTTAPLSMMCDWFRDTTLQLAP
jgi:hypothetical protein